MSKASAGEREIIEQYLLPYLSLKKSYPLFPGRESPEAEALLLGLTVEELKTYRANFEENARQAALEVLKDDEITGLIPELPLDGSETFAALGDSVTADAQGWFEILKNVLVISVPDEEFRFINAGAAGTTTTDALRRIDRDVLLHNPDWVFVALGTFDAQRLNILPERTLIPLSETWENIESIQQVLGGSVSNPVFWITPAPVLHQLLAENPLYEFNIEPHDLQQVRQLIAAKRGIIVDPAGNRMGEGEPQAWNYQSDGLNHTLSGHINTVKQILKIMVRQKENKR